jgi:hypothetical protein
MEDTKSHYQFIVDERKSTNNSVSSKAIDLFLLLKEASDEIVNCSERITGDGNSNQRSMIRRL